MLDNKYLIDYRRYCFLACLLLATACTPVQTTRPGAVGVAREQYMLLSSADVENRAANQYQQLKATAAKRRKLNPQAAQTLRLWGIADRLIAQTGYFRPDAPDWNWEVNVVEDPDLNAFCAAGGKIMFFSGLIDRLHLDDNEIAAIMGHEIAHALREHVREQASQAYGQQIAVGLIGAAAGTGGAGMRYAGLALDLLFNLPFSRDQESEADIMGLELMARAGYDPRAAISVWQKMEKAEDNGGTMEFLSTHPEPASRIAALQSYLPLVMPIYLQARSRSADGR